MSPLRAEPCVRIRAVPLFTDPGIEGATHLGGVCGHQAPSATEVRSGYLRLAPLQRLADPLPAARLVVRRPDQEGPRRVGQFGDDTDQLTVKVPRPALLMARSVPGDRYSRAIRAGQPHRDVPVAVPAGAGDI